MRQRWNRYLVTGASFELGITNIMTILPDSYMAFPLSMKMEGFIQLLIRILGRVLKCRKQQTDFEVMETGPTRKYQFR